jgi:segregation and condensation protein A
MLFNLSLLAKKDVWDIDITMLLQMLLNVINNTGSKDLRVCGIAVLSSSMIHRLKVESIFRLEKIAMYKRGVQDPQPLESIPELYPIEIPYRIESTYPVSLEDLLRILENMIFELANPRPRKKQIELDSVETFNFDQYLLKFEQILQEYENMILDIIRADETIMFKTLVNEMELIDVVRYFIAILYLATKEEINLESIEELDDIKITIRS